MGYAGESQCYYEIDGCRRDAGILQDYVYITCRNWRNDDQAGINGILNKMRQRVLTFIMAGFIFIFAMGFLEFTRNYKMDRRIRIREELIQIANFCQNQETF